MVKIIADSTCDLSPELLKRYDIDIIPLHILLGTDEYKDGLTITPEEIFRWSDENKTTPKTSDLLLKIPYRFLNRTSGRGARSSVFLFQTVCPPLEMSCGLLRRNWKPKTL